MPGGGADPRAVAQAAAMKYWGKGWRPSKIEEHAANRYKNSIRLILASLPGRIIQSQPVLQILSCFNPSKSQISFKPGKPPLVEASDSSRAPPLSGDLSKALNMSSANMGIIMVNFGVGSGRVRAVDLDGVMASSGADMAEYQHQQTQANIENTSTSSARASGVVGQAALFLMAYYALQTLAGAGGPAVSKPDMAKHWASGAYDRPVAALVFDGGDGGPGDDLPGGLDQRLASVGGDGAPDDIPEGPRNTDKTIKKPGRLAKVGSSIADYVSGAKEWALDKIAPNSSYAGNAAFGFSGTMEGLAEVLREYQQQGKKIPITKLYELAAPANIGIPGARMYTNDMVPAGKIKSEFDLLLEFKYGEFSWGLTKAPFKKKLKEMLSAGIQGGYKLPGWFKRDGPATDVSFYQDDIMLVRMSKKPGKTYLFKTTDELYNQLKTLN